MVFRKLLSPGEAIPETGSAADVLVDVPSQSQRVPEDIRRSVGQAIRETGDELRARNAARTDRIRIGEYTFDSWTRVDVTANTDGSVDVSVCLTVDLGHVPGMRLDAHFPDLVDVELVCSRAILEIDGAGWTQWRYEYQSVSRPSAADGPTVRVHCPDCGFPAAACVCGDG